MSSYELEIELPATSSLRRHQAVRWYRTSYLTLLAVIAGLTTKLPTACQCFTISRAFTPHRLPHQHYKPVSTPSFTPLHSSSSSIPPHNNDNKTTTTTYLKSTNSTTSTTSALSKTNAQHPPLTNRRLELQWCDPENCYYEFIREKITPDNHITFEGPATGQVAYTWATPLSQEQQQPPPSVLILVKRDSDELMMIAADATKRLTSEGVVVLLDAEVAAKLKHYFGVDHEECLKLFEARAVEGFGGNHIPSGENLMSFAGVGGVKEERRRERDAVDPDLICTLGGDGLLMHASMLFPGPVPPILCVAGGSMGFLTPFSKEEMVPAIRRSLGLLKRADDNDNDTTTPPGTATVPDNDITGPHAYVDPVIQPRIQSGYAICISMRMRLDCRVINREGRVRARFNVLNEVTIDRGGSPFLANLECFVDDVHLTTVQADGIIFSTPTGSTAYSMSAGGSVVHPAVPAILVTPICPHVLSFRSMIFPDSVVLRCYLPDNSRAGACVAFDGKYHRELLRGDSVQIQMSTHPVPTINRGDHSSDWLGSLKRSFNFNSRVVQKPL